MKTERDIHQLFGETPYRLLVEEIKDFAIFYLDANGLIVTWNKGAERLFGYTEREIIGREFFTLFTPEDRAAGAPEYELTKACETGRAEDVRWHLRKNDSRFYANGVTTALRDEAGELLGFAKIARDDTARKLMEERITESESRFRQMISQSPIAIVIFDTEGNAVSANQAHFDLWQIKPEVIEGYNIFRDKQARMHPDYRFIEEAFKGESVFVPATFYNLTDCNGGGRARWIEAFIYPVKDGEGNINEVVITQKDVTATRDAEKARLLLSAIVDSSPDAIMSFESDGTITSWNKGAERIYGYTEAEIVNRRMSILVPPELLAEQNQISSTLIRGESVTQYETERLRKDGTLFPISITASPVVNTEKRVIGFSAIAQDITPRRQAEREREQLLVRERVARREAETANRLKDEFLATLSHELRTPLTAILGWARMIRGGALSPARATQALEIIERNAQIQSQLINDILDVSRIITGKFTLDAKPITIAPVVNAALDVASHAAAAKHIMIETRFDDADARIYGDANRLQQIVWNLLSNAVKFTAPGGRITVDTRAAQNNLIIAVSDTGQGINREFLPFVFDRFRQADGSSTRAHGGLGLGLAIVRQIAEMHGGTVKVESAGEGEGATFTITLPLLDAPQHQSATTTQTECSHPAQPPVAAPANSRPNLTDARLLVVDDDDDTRELLSIMLQHAGAQVVVAASSPEAFAHFQQQRFDLIISDIGMPESDGYALLEDIRTHEQVHALAPTPVIALTAYARPADRTRALAAGFQSHLTKPIEPAELMHRIASAIESQDSRLTTDSAQ